MRLENARGDRGIVARRQPDEIAVRLRGVPALLAEALPDVVAQRCEVSDALQELRLVSQ